MGDDGSAKPLDTPIPGPTDVPLRPVALYADGDPAEVSVSVYYRGMVREGPARPALAIEPAGAPRELVLVSARDDD
ncbi:MAG: hypothetical protein H6739_26075 [Alphaproteobacteria bacterium]|nr:hypothetical protein [Alphaproteobacteria bacterium]